MAWRIEDHVLRGEVDNRVKGVVQGQIWLAGMEIPIKLSLTGNACPDLAGCLLTFRNPGEAKPLPGGRSLFPIQEGSIGDLTASRKVRVFEVPMEEAFNMLNNGTRPPERMSNSLYLEWFSTRNGRVVIESADYELEISEHEWKLTKEEETQRIEDARTGLQGFMDQLTQALENAKEKVDYEKENWDEFDYEHFLKESDARTDKYMELLDKYGDSEKGQEMIAQEMGWHTEDSKSEDVGETEFEIESIDPEWKDAPDEEQFPELIPDPATEGKDWIRTKDGDIRHPLQQKCFQGAISIWNEIKDLGLNEESDSISQLQIEYQTTGAKLAGALNNLAYGRNNFAPAFAAACLKRALTHLHAAQKALVGVQKENILPPETTERIRNEFFEIREGILHLLDEFRGR
ncbi:MAG: hypothetical protein O3C43_03115 [Verrucomicrobia bacterium]|nr:hypothetical protein [Verrucomicrobiota bacterium]MDA1065473.1 hypothetical protein [Verrucomicrobiota bacterium]